MSDTDAQLLTHDLLDRFRAALATAGAPLADAIEPGLSDPEIDQLVGELGLKVPPELRTLWTWGTVTEHPAPDGWDINPEYGLWPPRVAVTKTKERRKEDPTFSRKMISFGGLRGGDLVVEGDPAAARSRVLDASVDDEPFQAGPSLGALFELWTTQLANRDYRYSDGFWEDVDEPLVFIPSDDD